MKQGLPPLEYLLLKSHASARPLSYFYAHPDASLDTGAQHVLDELVKRRLGGEPMAYLLGQKEFWSLSFKVTPQVLIPRPDTETLIEFALALPLPQNARVLDLGTGSGAISIALKKERPDWAITAADISPDALLIAQENASLHEADIRFIESDWFTALKGETFDLIVSNPPYLEENDAHLLGDIRFEPIQALVAGPTGFEDIQHLIEHSRAHLNAGGWLLLEHGYTQAAQVRQYFDEFGFSNIQSVRDLSQIERITVGRSD
ncbi:MAG: peptide chain release factor N(5)-glutamine methyltransferase [Gammaproteobacteria bacterium]|nr:peptide chain release factor N(5)-glutamine methyltransferase [Gammaproteobacteria bacterium]